MTVVSIKGLRDDLFKLLPHLISSLIRPFFFDCLYLLYPNHGSIRTLS